MFPSPLLRFLTSCCLPLLLAVIFLTGCSRKTVKETVVDGYKGKAWENPFLALERLLATKEIAWEASRNWSDIIKYGDAFVVVPAEVDEVTKISLLERMESRGGDIIFFLSGTRGRINDFSDFGSFFRSAQNHREESLLLDKLGLSLVPSLSSTIISSPIPIPSSSSSTSSSSTEKQTYAAIPDAELQKEYTLEVPKRQALLSVGANAKKVQWSASANHQQTPAVTMKLRKARVTVITSATPFRNKSLALEQNAPFIVDFISTYCENGSVLFLQAKQPTFWAMLIEHFGKALTGLGLLLVLWLWHRMPRFGPMLRTAPVYSATKFTDHLKLSGHFLWRRGQTAALISGFRNAITHQLHCHHQHWSLLDDSDLVPRLALLAKLPLERVEKAWLSVYEREAPKFTEYVQDLQTVLQALKAPTRS